MRRLISSDWQLAYNDRDRYRTDFVVKTLPKLIDNYKVDQLLVLGDICEAKDSHPAPLVNEIVNTFHDLSKKCEIIILEGNHDYLHENHPFFEFVACFDNISWISVPTVRDNCLYLPHTRDYKKEWGDVNFEGHDFIFAHNIFTGVSTQTGHALAGIPPSIFPKDAVCISGDVHEPQIINENIIYVGSPTLTDFGDDYTPRVLLLDDLNIKSIKVGGQQKRLINVGWLDGVIPDGLYHKANQGDIVKIQVNLEMKDVAEWAMIRQEVEQWAAKKNFVVNSIIPNIAYVKGERQKIINSSQKSDTNYLNAFVNRLGIDDKTMEVGKGIIDLI